MRKQLGFFVDVRRCIGCFTCAMACKNQYHQPTGVKWRDVFPINEELRYLTPWKPTYLSVNYLRKHSDKKDKVLYHSI